MRVKKVSFLSISQEVIVKIILKFIFIKSISRKFCYMGQQQQKILVMKMKYLRILGKIRKDTIKREEIRIVEIKNDVVKIRLKWYGHEGCQTTKQDASEKPKRENKFHFHKRA